MQIMNYYIVIFVIGSIIGSFLNMLIFRLPRGNRSEKFALKILTPYRSKCIYCNKTIKPLDNIPIFSWFVLRGSCRDCNKPIPKRYIFVEIITPTLFCFLVWKFHGDGESFLWMFFVSLMITIGFTDKETFLLPKILTFTLLIAGTISTTFSLINTTINSSILGSIFGFFFLFFINKIYYLLKKKNGIGDGDPILFAGIGSWLGIESLMWILMTACFLGFCIEYFFNINKNKMDFYGLKVPLGFYLAFASISCLILK